MFDRRQHPRAWKPEMRVLHQGNIYRASDWSAGGLKIAAFRGEPVVGTQLSVSIAIDEFKLPWINVRLKVIRWIDQSKVIAGEYQNVAEEFTRRLNGHAMNGLRLYPDKRQRNLRLATVVGRRAEDRR